MNNMNHPLHAPSSELLDESDRQFKERVRFTYSAKALRRLEQMASIYVIHPDAKLALAQLDRAYQLAGVAKASQSVAVLGPTGAGKTELIKYFLGTLPRETLIDKSPPAMVVRLQARPAAGWMVSTLLRRVGYPFSTVSDRQFYTKRDHLIEALRNKKCKLLVIDEAHHLATAANTRDLRRIGTNVTDVLKELVDELGLMLVLCGDDVGLQDVLNQDTHLRGRAPNTIRLKDFQNGRDWNGVVAKYVKHVPEISFEALMTSKELNLMREATGGNQRNLKWFLTEVVMICVDENCSVVERHHLCLAYDRLFGKHAFRANPYGSLDHA